MDDDEDDYHLTREVVVGIPGGGYTLDWVADFEPALEMVCGGNHDVYLVDFRLGARTGLDLVVAARTRGCAGPFILLTGVGHPEIDRAAEAAGVVDYLEKGRVDPVLLERSIRYALRQRAQELELERKVTERTAELAAANAALEEAARRKDEFLATLAHELRNPLAPIRHAVEILRMTADPAGAEAARQVIERQMRHLIRLIDDLLDASRLTRGKLRLDLTQLDLADPLHTAIEAAHPLLERGGLVLTSRLPDHPLVVTGDPVRLAQVFANLLTNAAKYTGSGGRVTVTAEAIGYNAVVRITDTGVGIPPDMISRVFDLFAQVDATLDRAPGGLGIGLALVKRLAELHGGGVAAHSGGLGHGAEFVVTLPLARSGAPSVPALISEPPPRAISSKRSNSSS